MSVSSFLDMLNFAEHRYSKSNPSLENTAQAGKTLLNLIKDVLDPQLLPRAARLARTVALKTPSACTDTNDEAASVWAKLVNRIEDGNAFVAEIVAAHECAASEPRTAFFEAVLKVAAQEKAVNLLREKGVNLAFRPFAKPLPPCATATRKQACG